VLPNQQAALCGLRCLNRVTDQYVSRDLRATISLSEMPLAATAESTVNAGREYRVKHHR